MELKNGYKVIYDKAANGEHVFYASESGIFADAEEIAKIAAGEYKLVYEKAGRVYGSESGIPAEGDYCFEAFDKVFVEAEAGNEADAANEEPVAPVAEEEPEVANETPANVEEPTVDETDE
jgi:hypothetical protein